MVPALAVIRQTRVGNNSLTQCIAIIINFLRLIFPAFRGETQAGNHLVT